MCLGIPGEVIEVRAGQPDLATVNVHGLNRLINIGLLAEDPPGPGDWVLIHVGFALSRIDRAEAAAAMQVLEGVLGPGGESGGESGGPLPAPASGYAEEAWQTTTSSGSSPGPGN